MNRLTVTLLATLIGTVAYAAPEEKDAEKDITKFCYHDGKPHSEGAKIFSPDKKDQLVCRHNPHGIHVSGFDKAPEPLQWVSEAELQRLMAMGRSQNSQKGK